MASGMHYCSKCNKTMADTNFYTYKNGDKCELCKACLTMHINNFEPDTFLWLLEKFDVPWIPAEWNVLRDRAYQKDPYKINGMSVFGRYLSKMKLKQWGEHNHWADTQYWAEKAEKDRERFGGTKAEEEQQKIEEMKQAFENGEISEAQYKTYAEIHAPEPVVEPPAPTNQPAAGPGPSQQPFYPVNDHPFEEVELADVGADLTDEDKVYLAMKWGRLYRADEWVYLEKKYKEFMESFDIKGAARMDTLLMICKTSLKMNQAIDCGDVETYQKLSRVYDAMMKAAKFTEAQRQEEKAGDFDAVGQIVYFAEKEGGKIPRYETSIPLDVVDKAIADLKKYNHDLIVNDPALSQMFENFLKRRENAQSQKKDLEEAEKKGLDRVEIKDEDYLEFNKLLRPEEEEEDVE